MDSLLSIVQMPGGVPVGTLAIGKAGATERGAAGRCDSRQSTIPSCARSCAVSAKSRPNKVREEATLP